MFEKHRRRFQEELAAVPLFSTLTPEQIASLAGRAYRAREPAGMTFTRTDERGDELVVVLDGAVDVMIDGNVVATLGIGDFVGENALMDPDARRTATVVARSPVVVAYIGRHDFEALLAGAPTLRDMLDATRAERTGSPDAASGSGDDEARRPPA